MAVSDKFYVWGIGAEILDYFSICQVGEAEKAMIKALEAKIGQDDKEILKQYKEFKTKYPDGLVSSPAGVLLVDQEHIYLCYQDNVSNQQEYINNESFSPQMTEAQFLETSSVKGSFLAGRLFKSAPYHSVLI